MGGQIWTDSVGNICNIPAEYTYASGGNLWYAEYASRPSVSGASVTMFIETGANTAQGSICVYSTSEVTVRLLELPASGQSHASIGDADGTNITVYNILRYPSGATDNLTKIKLGNNGIWQREDAATVLQTIQGSGNYPVDSVRSRAYWVLDSSATYALTVASGADDNYVTVAYTWNETNV